MNHMDATTKFFCITGITISLALLIAVIGCAINDNRIIREGYQQENVTYCSSISTKTIWVKK